MFYSVDLYYIILASFAVLFCNDYAFPPYKDCTLHLMISPLLVGQYSLDYLVLFIKLLHWKVEQTQCIG